MVLMKTKDQLVKERNEQLRQKEWESTKRVRQRINERLKKRENYKIGSLLRSRLYHALKSTGVKKSKSALEFLGCTIPEFREYFKTQFQTGMTWENHKFYGWHIDHIIPCASFDLSDPEQQKLCFHYTNLQPLWRPDNLSKGAKILQDQQHDLIKIAADLDAMMEARKK